MAWLGQYTSTLEQMRAVFQCRFTAKLLIYKE
jgi:hypothetical protein